MAFDDLAKHMAARDGKKKLTAAPGTGDQIMAEAAMADRRMTRTRNLILGSILLVGGGVMLLVYMAYLDDAANPNPSPGRPPSGDTYVTFPWWPVMFVGMMITGARQLFQGLKRVR